MRLNGCYYMHERLERVAQKASNRVAISLQWPPIRYIKNAGVGIVASQLA